MWMSRVGIMRAGELFEIFWIASSIASSAAGENP